MKTLISFLAINWSMYRTVSITVLIILALGFFLWGLLFIMFEKWEKRKIDHDIMMKTQAMGVDFPKPLSVEVIRKDAEGDPNRMIWSLNPGSSFEDLSMKLQKYLDLKLNPRLDISIKVYPRQNGGVWINFRKKEGSGWEEIFIQGEEVLEFFFNKHIEFSKPKVPKVIDKAGQITSG